jgi:hypothetical protein
MIWALDMDDFSGKFCRVKRKKPLRRFPLVNAMKEVFEEDEKTTPMTTVPLLTNSLSNETIFLKAEFHNLLDQMFDEASSSSRLWHSYALLFQILLNSVLI